MNKLLLAILLFVGSSCHRNLVVQQLPQHNPTTFTYPFALEKVKAVIMKEFYNHSFYAMSLISAEEEIKTNKAEQLFRTPSNKNDFYLHKDYHPFHASPVYTDTAGKGYPYYAEFHLHLVSLDSTKTTVQVITYEPVIAYGKSWFAWHGVGRVDRAKSVKPTTIEEYEILLRVGKGLGMTDQMPALNTVPRNAPNTSLPK